MAYSADPVSVLPGILFRSTNGAGALTVAAGLTKDYILIDKADLPSFNSGDDADVRRIFYAILDGIYQGLDGITSADRPTKWIGSRSNSFNSAGDTITRTIVNQFYTEISGEEVAAE